jgi:simple sugar transport system ATP-binding protein
MFQRTPATGGGETAVRPPLLEAAGIHRSFGQVQALRGVDFTVDAGEVVALIGDNGAGKSSLVKILSGADSPDAGRILLDGQEVHFGSVDQARARGIEAVYQDLALCAELPPAANFFLGREILRGGVLGRLGWLDNRAMRAQTRSA